MIKEPFEVYHAKRKDYLTSHQLADFRKSPLLYHQKQLGLIQDSDSQAYLVGRALHTLVLEGRDVYESRVAIGGPVNPKTGQPYGPTTKKFKEWAEAQDKDVLSDSQAALVEEMAAGVSRHPIARNLLKGTTEAVIREEISGIDCQIRMDCVNEGFGIVDLKSCRDLDQFEEDSIAYGYGHQMAFYQMVYQHSTGNLAPVYLVAIEKQGPYRCGVWELDEDWILDCREQNLDAMAEMKKCNKTNQWSTRYERVRSLKPCH